MNRKAFVLLAILSLLVMSPIGLLLVVFLQEESISHLFFSSNFSWISQILIGTTYGIVGAATATSLLKISFFKPVKSFFGETFKGIQLSILDVLLISVCVGIGEELLFRAGIQPFLGVWITSVIFVLAHGMYLDPRRLPFFVVGLFMILLSSGLGYLFEYVSITSAIVAHVVYDAISLGVILKENKIIENY
ncbi:MAG: CPBP family intramembrane glutamic endopeptidase [Chitinophagales bacterium]